MKDIIIEWEGTEPERLKSTVGQIINHMVDFGYGYDMQDEVVDALAEVLLDVDINFTIEVDDFGEDDDE